MKINSLQKYFIINGNVLLNIIINKMNIIEYNNRKKQNLFDIKKYMNK